MLSIRKTASRVITNKIEAKDTKNEKTIYLYGPIGGWFGIDHQEWVKEFNAIKANTIHLRIDSEGGDIFAARTMKTAVMQHPAKVVAHIDGLAASAASFLAMGADEIEIVDGGFFMIHNAMSIIDILGYFNEDDLNQLIENLTKERDLHGKINESIANDYVKKTGNSLEKVMEWMSEETWFTAKEAVDNNFADRIYDGEPVENSYDLSIFANAPEDIRAKEQKTTKRMIEKALRDGGLTNREAKKILSEGFREELRDEDTTIDPEEVVELQRDVVDRPKDRIAELLTRAEMTAPSN